MGRPQLRTETLRARFVAEAVAAIEGDGLGSLTTRGIADASESSLAALNELFGAKAGLVAAAALHGFSMLADTLEQLDDREAADPIEAVFLLCQAHRDFTDAHPRLLALMYSRPFADFNPGDTDRVTAATIRGYFTTRTAVLTELDRFDKVVIDQAVGLVSLLEGLTRQQQAGTLGSTAASTNRRWTSAVHTYLTGMRVNARLG